MINKNNIDSIHVFLATSLDVMMTISLKRIWKRAQMMMTDPYNQIELNLNIATIREIEPSLKAQLSRKIGAYLTTHQAWKSELKVYENMY